MKILLSLSFLILVSCSLQYLKDENNCKFDYQNLGEEHGKAGLLPSEFAVVEKKCAKDPHQPDQARYLSGHKIGAKKYCTEKNGLALGKSGQSYSQICSAKDLKKLQAGWIKGLADYCDYKQGVEFGKTGKPYISFCPKKQEAKFKKGYNDGKKIFNQKKK